MSWSAAQGITERTCRSGGRKGIAGTAYFSCGSIVFFCTSSTIASMVMPIRSFDLPGGMKNENSIDTPHDSIVISRLCVSWSGHACGGRRGESAGSVSTVVVVVVVGGGGGGGG